MRGQELNTALTRVARGIAKNTPQKPQIPPNNRTEEESTASLYYASNRVRFFRQLPLAATKPLLERAQPRIVPPNFVIIREGNLGTSIYVIIQGECTVHRLGFPAPRLFGSTDVDRSKFGTPITFLAGGDSFGGASAEFENTFSDALGTGQSIGQFLSNEAPNFSKFDVAPPSVSEQRTTKAVENLAERLGEEAAMENLQAQLESGEDGSERNETIAVAVIGYKAGFSAYTGMEQLTDQQDWYQVKALYTNAKIDDNKFSLYMMAGKSDKKMQEMVLQQYKQE